MINSYIKKAKDTNNTIEDRKENLDKAYSINATLDDDSFKIQKLREISFRYYHLKDHDRYKGLNEKALKLAKTISDSLEMAESYTYLGIYYRKSKSELDLALQNFHEADKIYKSLDPKKYEPKDYLFDHGKTLIDIARIQQKAKDYTESEATTIKAIKKFELAENNQYLPLCYTNLGIVAKYWKIMIKQLNII